MSKDDVRLIIASYGRPKHQSTIKNLPEEIRKRIELWVVPKEYKAYKAEGYKVQCITKWPDGVDTIFKKRKWLAANVRDPFLMLDDDLQLMYWDSKSSKYCIAKNNPDQFVRVFDKGLLSLFDKYDMVSCTQKFMAEQYIREHGAVKEGTPGFVVSGYNPGVCDEVDFTRTHLLSDTNQNIQAIQQGKASVIFYGIAFSQSSATALNSTGCGTYRTDFVRIDAAMKMLHYFKGIVVDARPTKTANGGGVSLTKRMARLKTGVNIKHELESINRLRQITESFGMSKIPKMVRWKMDEPMDDIVNRLKSAWVDAGFTGNFNKLSLTDKK